MTNTGSDKLLQLTINVECWEDARSIGALLPNFVFRGHCDTEWKLESSFERMCNRFGLKPEHRLKAERDCIIEFRRRAEQYLKHLPAEADLVGWFGLVQHHGACTRLLDFTSSFYVGAFFAVEDARGMATIWAVNRRSLDDSAHLTLTSRGTTRDGGSIGTRVVNYATEVFRTQSAAPGVICVEPFQLHERLSIQQGVFLMPADVTQPFESNLLASLTPIHGDNCLVRTWDEARGEGRHTQTSLNGVGMIRVNIPFEQQGTAIRDLKEMNVTAASLFSGLDGVARSLRFWIRTLGQTSSLEDFGRYMGIDMKSMGLSTQNLTALKSGGTTENIVLP